MSKMMKASWMVGGVMMMLACTARPSAAGAPAGLLRPIVAHAALASAPARVYRPDMLRYTIERQTNGEMTFVKVTVIDKAMPDIAVSGRVLLTFELADRAVSIAADSVAFDSYGHATVAGEFPGMGQPCVSVSGTWGDRRRAVSGRLDEHRCF